MMLIHGNLCKIYINLHIKHIIKQYIISFVYGHRKIYLKILFIVFIQNITNRIQIY